MECMSFKGDRGVCIEELKYHLPCLQTLEQGTKPLPFCNVQWSAANNAILDLSLKLIYVRAVTNNSFLFSIHHLVQRCQKIVKMSISARFQGDTFVCLVLSDQRLKTPRYSVYCHRRLRTPEAGSNTSETTVPWEHPDDWCVLMLLWETDYNDASSFLHMWP